MSGTMTRLGLVLAVGLVSCAEPGPRTAAAAPAAQPARTSPADGRDSALAASTTVDALHAVAVGEVRDALERYYADFSARDWPAFASHFWPGATITTTWQPEGESAARVVVTGVPEFVAQAPEGPGSKAIFEERITGAETRIEGNLAQVWAHYDARFGDPGDVREWSGIDAFTLMKHDGEWKIVALAFTSEE